MSTVRVKKPHDGHKPGDLISVPFGKGRDLVKLGLCEYPPEAAGAKPAQPDALAAARKRVGDLEAENAALKAEVAELKELMGAADKAEKAGTKAAK